MGCLYCLFSCLACFGYRDNILKRYAFHPPKCSYAFKELLYETPQNLQNLEKQEQDLESRAKKRRQSQMSQKSIVRNSSNYEILLLNSKGIPVQIPVFPEIIVQGFKISTGKKSQKGERQVASLFLKNVKNPSDYLLIFSHGNSTDLGWMLDSYLDLAYNCKINVLAYDYGGYGISEGKTTDLTIIEDIEAQYLFARNQLKFEWNKIILYGQSLGSGPSTYLASNSEFPVGGLIIHSGFTSGLRVMLPDLKNTHKHDFFPNIDLLKYTRCPVFLIHGTRDQEIPYQHCEENASQANRKYIWRVLDAGHNNIESDKKHRKEYFLKLREFIQTLVNDNNSKTVGEIYKSNKAIPWDVDFNHIYKQKLNILKSFSISSKGSEVQQSQGAEYSVINSSIEDTSNKQLQQSLKQNLISNKYRNQSEVRKPQTNNLQRLEEAAETGKNAKSHSVSTKNIFAESPMKSTVQKIQVTVGDSNINLDVSENNSLNQPELTLEEQKYIQNSNFTVDNMNQHNPLQTSQNQKQQNETQQQQQQQQQMVETKYISQYEQFSQMSEDYKTLGTQESYQQQQDSQKYSKNDQVTDEIKEEQENLQEK